MFFVVLSVLEVLLKKIINYENMSVQYAAIAKSGKNDTFLDEKL